MHRWIRKEKANKISQLFVVDTNSNNLVFMFSNTVTEILRGPDAGISESVEKVPFILFLTVEPQIIDPKNGSFFL